MGRWNWEDLPVVDLRGRAAQRGFYPTAPEDSDEPAGWDDSIVRAWRKKSLEAFRAAKVAKADGDVPMQAADDDE
jgi:hypothetical protein